MELNKKYYLLLCSQINKQVILLLLETQKPHEGHHVLESGFHKCEMWKGPKIAQVKPQPYRTKC